MRSFLVWLDTFAPLIALLVGWRVSKKASLQPHERLLIVYLCAVVVLNGLANTISEIEMAFVENNHFVYHFSNLVYISLLSLYFAFVPVLQRFSKVIISLCAAFVITSIIHKLYTHSYMSFDSIGFGVPSVFLTILSMFYYYNLLKSQKGEDLFGLPDFFFVTGIFFYFASSFFVFLLYQHYIELGISNIGWLWRFQNIMLSIMCLFFIKGFLCRVSRTSLLL